MTHEDEQEFLAAIRKIAPLKLLLRYFSSESKMELQFLPPVGSLEGDASLCLANATLAAEPTVASYPQQSCYSIDLLQSEVVEFSRCRPLKTWLNDGRLWFDDRTSEGEKSPAFIKWANSLLGWIRSNYKRDVRGYFVGPHAEEISQAGKLHLGPPVEPELSLEERKRMLGFS